MDQKLSKTCCLLGLLFLLLTLGPPYAHAEMTVIQGPLPLTSGQSGSLWVAVNPDQIVVGSCNGSFKFGGGVPDYRTYVHESFRLTKTGATEYTFCATTTGDFAFQVWDRTGNTTHGRIKVIPVGSTKPTSPSVDLLKNIWRVTEGDPTWTGVWSRRGNSNVFDAIWRHSSGQTASGVLTISLSGNSVTITRGSGQYTGTISGSSASGTASWYNGGQRWTATIE